MWVEASESPGGADWTSVAAPTRLLVIGDEPALLVAIRRDTRVAGSDDDITDAICDAMDDGVDAAACLERLAAPR